jgi:type II secretory pathway pseudopilin PulG
MPTSATGSRARQAGFALLDVLVALVVLGLGLAALLRMLGGAAGLGHGAELQARALTVAENRLADALSAPLTLGQFDGVEDGLNWQVRISRDSETAWAAIPVPYTLAVVVGEGGQPRVSLTTVRLGPP